MNSIVILIAMTLLVLAAATDFLYAIIPNMISIALTLLFVAYALVAGYDMQHWLAALGCAAGVLAFGFGLFAVGAIGGGDAKLLAATALWAGWPDVLNMLLVVALIGAVVTLPLLVSRKGFGRLRLKSRVALGPSVAQIGVGRPIEIEIVQPTDEMIPYGIAIAVGALMTVFVGLRV